VLADLGGDDGVSAGDVVDLLDHVLWGDALGRIGVVGECMILSPLLEVGFPLALGSGFHLGDEFLEDHAGIADDADLRRADLVDLGAVDVDVDDLGLRGELGGITGDAVVEAGADGDDETRVLQGMAGVGRAVHAGHSESQVLGFGEDALGKERVGDADVGLLRQLAHEVGGTGGDGPAAHVEDGLGGGVDLLGGEADQLGVALAGRGIAWDGLGFGLAPVTVAGADVEGDVDEHGAGASGACDVEGLAHDVGEIAGVLHQVAMLGDRHGDAEGVGLLEGVGPDVPGADLPGDGDERYGVHVGRGEPRDEVHRARAAGGHADADASGGSGVAVGGVHRALLMAGHDMAHPA